jgi:hypothetical protein
MKLNHQRENFITTNKITHLAPKFWAMPLEEYTGKMIA